MWHLFNFQNNSSNCANDLWIRAFHVCGDGDGVYVVCGDDGGDGVHDLRRDPSNVLRDPCACVHGDLYRDDNGVFSVRCDDAYLHVPFHDASFCAPFHPSVLCVPQLYPNASAFPSLHLYRGANALYIPYVYVCVHVSYARVPGRDVPSFCDDNLYVLYHSNVYLCGDSYYDDDEIFCVSRANVSFFRPNVLFYVVYLCVPRVFHRHPFSYVYDIYPNLKIKLKTK